jgi:hypothetical protein
LFVVLLLAGSACLGELLGAFGDNDHVFEAHFGDPTARVLDIAGGYLLTLAGISFAVFAVSCSRPVQVSGLDSMLLGTAQATGLLFSALLIVAASVLMTVSLSIVIGEAYGDPRSFNPAYAMIPQAGCALAVVVAPIAAAAHIASHTAARRHSAPRALTILGAVCATALLFSILYLPLLALPLWVLAVVAGERGGASAASTQPK